MRLLVDRGADIEARDTTWDSIPLEWAIVGSGMRLGGALDADWPGTVRALLDAGASADGIVLSPDDQKPLAGRVDMSRAPTVKLTGWSVIMLRSCVSELEGSRPGPGPGGGPELDGTGF